MNKKIILISSIVTVFIFFFAIVYLASRDTEPKEINRLYGTVMQYDKNTVTIEDSKHMMYTFDIKNVILDVGDYISIEYTGVLDKNNRNQQCEVISYQRITDGKTTTPSPTAKSGIFSRYETQAKNKLKTLNLDEKIGQLLLVRYPGSNAVDVAKKYHVSGFAFYEKDFKDKTETEVRKMIQDVQNAASIPLLTSVDEEGGNVVRVSSNPNLAKEKFKSPIELYKNGGLPAIKQDTIDKSRLLYGLGLNVNLAPVVDVSTNNTDYIYPRALQEDTALTSSYAKTVIEASKNTGVSYVLKHFPGYGNTSIDNRTLDDLKKNDLPPFESGIAAGAEAVLVGHNTVNNIDSKNPASLSSNVHNLLRNDLGFTGVIIADDIAMGALNGIDDPAVKAILAGNDLVITTDYEESFNSIKSAVQDGTVSEDTIDELALRVLSWKYHKLLLVENQK